MPKTIISEGKTTNEAIEKGLRELKTYRDNVEVKVIEEKKRSFFSILDPHVVKVELTVKDENRIRDKKTVEINEQKLDEAKKEIEKFLNEFLSKISKDITFKIDTEEQVLKIEMFGKEATKLIGYRGEALNALQLILSTIAQNRIEEHIQVVVDTENYRSKRIKTLQELAVKIEKTVTKTGKKITLEPMSPYERKIIHTELQDSDYVKTYSIGKDDNRRIVIAKK